jgi:hypothetical protein
MLVPALGPDFFFFAMVVTVVLVLVGKVKRSAWLILRRWRSWDVACRSEEKIYDATMTFFKVKKPRVTKVRGSAFSSGWTSAGGNLEGAAALGTHVHRQGCAARLYGKFLRAFVAGTDNSLTTNCFRRNAGVRLYLRHICRKFPSGGRLPRLFDPTPSKVRAREKRKEPM